MATIYQNLSDYNPDEMPTKEIVETQSYAIIVAEWNPEITKALKEAAIETLLENGVLAKNIRIVHVPGAFELTHAAAKLSGQLQEGKKSLKYSAVIALGCVIQGDTPHFTFVCDGVTQGITELNLQKDRCPVIFGVLTTNTLQQAEDRAGGKHGNKGDEAAIAAIKMANIVW